MRELPSLTTLCMRALGSQSCSAEDTFAATNGNLSTASRMLRSFRNANIPKRPCIGPGSARRTNANDVDLNHPFIAQRESPPDENDDNNNNLLERQLLMQYGNSALDFLQAYIDTLVELGRMDDGRLGIHFFAEWKHNLTTTTSSSSTNDDITPVRPAKKRRSSAATSSSSPDYATNPLGALSLHNCSIGSETVTALVKSGVGPHLAVLDLTGIRGMTDGLVEQILEATPNLQRVSFKNCRKLTIRVLQPVETKLKKLECLDLGGCFNISTNHVLDMVSNVPTLTELHASGLQWTDASISELVSHCTVWRGLSLGFSSNLTQSSLRESLIVLSHTLETLALPFCESVVDNALLGILGRNLPRLRALDLRGNTSLNTLTGWYDGRVSAELNVDSPLVVLARYTGVSAASVEETERAHPRARLTVILDGGGMGAGILRSA